MPAISFSTMKDKILNKSKMQTIRPKLSNYWLRFKKGDRLVGYWKLRQGGEKLFESVFSEDPFIVYYHDMLYDDGLMIRDGFTSAGDAYVRWFQPHYGTRNLDNYKKEFVVIRWK